MSHIFKKKNYETDNISTVISADVVIKGEINAQGSMRIDGKTEGLLTVKGDLIIGDKGEITGEIKVDNLILGGKIEGNAFVSGRCEITATGILNGDITCDVLIIDEGGRLNGNSQMNKHLPVE